MAVTIKDRNSETFLDMAKKEEMHVSYGSVVGNRHSASIANAWYKESDNDHLLHACTAFGETREEALRNLANACSDRIIAVSNRGQERRFRAPHMG